MRHELSVKHEVYPLDNRKRLNAGLNPIQCSYPECQGAAAMVERRKTVAMPAAGWYPYCSEHDPRVVA